jgi:hypothetical protein
MRKTSLLAAAAIAAGFAAFAGGTPAQAANLPYCLSGSTAGGGSTVTSCQYMTFNQCQRTAQGTGQSCVRNPNYAYGYGPGVPDDAYAMAPAPDGYVAVPAPYGRGYVAY